MKEPRVEKTIGRGFCKSRSDRMRLSVFLLYRLFCRARNFWEGCWCFSIKNLFFYRKTSTRPDCGRGWEVFDLIFADASNWIGWCFGSICHSVFWHICAVFQVWNSLCRTTTSITFPIFTIQEQWLYRWKSYGKWIRQKDVSCWVWKRSRQMPQWPTGACFLVCGAG